MKEEFDASEIEPGLWVGSLAAAEDCKALLKKQITSVITVASRLHPQLAWPSLDAASIAFSRLDIEDHPQADLLGILPKALRAIDKVIKVQPQDESDRAGVLVHCASGMSRSVSVCMAWLMLRRGATMQEALQTIKGVRREAAPNPGFLQALKLLQDENCNIQSAHKLWKKANNVSEATRNTIVQKLRKKSDRLAEKASSLEEQLQQQCGKKEGGTVDLKALARLVPKLKKLSQDIVKTAPRSTTDDSVAKSVRYITAEKVQQLLKTWEPLMPEAVEFSEEGPEDSVGVDDLEDVEEANDEFLQLPGVGSGPIVISL